MKQLKADYLVIGAGAMGMAFVDVLMTETDATFVMVDLHDRPGGHWNDAYPFVRLHQPSAFYGVNSRRLGSDQIDEVGGNKGLFELASGSEVLAYFDQVMNQQLLPSGRVQYFPQSEYLGEGQFRNLVSGEVCQVNATKIVDASYMNVTVPSVTKPGYEVAEGVTCFPLNELPRQKREGARYVIVGAGKTGIDACLWLLDRGLDPDQITWIMPRDSWLLNRANIQPGVLGHATASNFVSQAKAALEAESYEDLFLRLEANGNLLRLDKDHWPTMYRCATVTEAELSDLRKIKNIVRKGRVTNIKPGLLQLDGGEIELPDNTLIVDCSADGLEKRPVVSVFSGDQITLQAVRTCQQVFSAAFIGHIEASLDEDDQKNDICTPVPHPDTDVDWIRTTMSNAVNGFKWSQDPGLTEWLVNSRLDGFSQVRAADAPDAPGINMLEVYQKLETMLAAAEEGNNK